LDELGRGTSTFDGYSIAYSVIRYLAEKIQCRTLFSTHYFMLTEELKNHPLIDLFQMKCNVDTVKNHISFLHRYLPGVCDKSYGLNVARMAQIPHEIVIKAEEISERAEKASLEKNEKMKKDELKEEQIELFNKIRQKVKSGATREELQKLQKEALSTFLFFEQ
jgi:DNA mismatch repair protein MSH6